MNHSKKSLKKRSCLVFDRINIPFKNTHVAISHTFIPMLVIAAADPERQYYSQNLIIFSHFVGFFNVKLLLRDEIARQKL